jgi:hypothetical protein
MILEGHFQKLVLQGIKIIIALMVTESKETRKELMAEVIRYFQDIEKSI